MEFLFHTIIYYNEKPVYYNVSKTSIGYFGEVIDNPHNVREAIDFDLENNDLSNPEYSQYKPQIEMLWAEINGHHRQLFQ